MQGATASALEKTQVAGQCYFLRAMGYYSLVRAFGPLPLFLTPTSPDVSLPRSPVADIYASIISDLQAAQTMLPASWSAQYVGKASSMAARPMLAEVYLTLAASHLNKTQHYAPAPHATVP